MSTLLVIKGPAIGVKYDLGERTRIGRSEENEIFVPDPNVSRLHAEIVRQRLAFLVRDCGSLNGVTVNGKPVKEQLLLRNDEVVVGNTVFLFNSDLNLQNARFSSNSVYFQPLGNETIVDASSTVPMERPSSGERETVNFLLAIADIFAAPLTTLGEACERLLEQVLLLMDAESGVLLLRDRPDGDARPMVAIPRNEPLTVNQEVVAAALKEGRATLSSDGQPKGPPPSGYSSMAAPIEVEGRRIGVLIVSKKEADCFNLRHLGMLQAVARLTAGRLEAIRELEAVRLQKTGSSRLFAAPSRNPAILEIFDQAMRVASVDTTVLITGESGTGKEVLARYIHGNSHRANGPFVAVNCSAIPPQLFESELFGYERGAFTGAAKTTAGKAESAFGGTLFLDEIGDLDLALQPKLLRFLQERAFYRVGGTRAIVADARVLAATNSDLEANVRAGTFREDLWFRLNVIHFLMPPLRERREDIGTLADSFVRRHSRRLGKRIHGITDNAVMVLEKHDWPGNIRELENAVERAVLLASGTTLDAPDFSFIARNKRRIESPSGTNLQVVVPLAEMERRMIEGALKEFGGNQARTAEALGIHRNTLRNKIIEYKIAMDSTRS